MKPEYQHTRFLVQGMKQVPTATEQLRNHLASAGYSFFSVTGCSPDLRHQEPGFGIVYKDRDHIVQLGREWRQEAIFWIEHGIVHLVPCGNGEAVTLGEWNAVAQHPG